VAPDAGSPDYTITPASRTIIVNGADVTGVDFVATPSPHLVFGTLSRTEPRGSDIPQVFLIAADGTQRVASPDAQGHFVFVGVDDGSYELTLNQRAYRRRPFPDGPSTRRPGTSPSTGRTCSASISPAANKSWAHVATRSRSSRASDNVADPMPDLSFPLIVKRTEIDVSRWVRLVANDVRTSATGDVETWHSLAQADYVAILARTPDGRIPIVRQFRPAVNGYTWELPAGMIDAGDTPEATCRRELAEETGLLCRSLRYLGDFDPDTGRLENRAHVFLIEAEEAQAAFLPEPGLEVRLVTLAELRALIRNGGFRHLLHIAALMLAEIWNE
jgi:ADP-ribose pyrophosphatase